MTNTTIREIENPPGSARVPVATDTAKAKKSDRIIECNQLIKAYDGVTVVDVRFKD